MQKLKKYKNKRYFFFIFVFISVFPIFTFAHQPRIPDSNQTVVLDPEISKAYYAKLSGDPQVYTISSDKAFNLYVNILVPDIADQKKDVNLALFKKNGQSSTADELLTIFDNGNNNWEKFFEPFGYDSYWKGAEYRQAVPAGNYEIRIWSSNNDSKYVLAVGEKESFPLKETLRTVKLIPEIKKNFFNESPINFILSPIGWGFVLVVFILAFIIGFIFRLLVRKIAKRKNRTTTRNIGKTDRIFRAILGLALFLIAISTSWSPILLFLAGFMLFEAIFSWCGFYAAVGKNTCPR
ncbi:MAG TPA: DUF2892 domain-containing protein [Candidatus Paceibacterota bacterium]|nr:DUF2892 domain-containing protein [Candidatus Paceibacterota bacterium]